MTAGMAKMNTTDWRSRKNDFSSTRPRDQPTRHTPGSGARRSRAVTEVGELASCSAVTAGLPISSR